MSSKNMLIPLAKDARGNYRKDLGWKTDPDGSRRQHRFYLGKDSCEAQIRALGLERLWTALEKRQYPAKPTWDAMTLEIGMAISRGDGFLVIDPAHHGLTFGDWLADDRVESAMPEDQRRVFIANEEAKLSWFRQLQEDYGQGIKLILAGEEDTCRQVEEKARRLQEQVEKKKQLARPSCGQTLHAALDAFSEALGQKYNDGSGRVSAFGQLCKRQTGNIKGQAKDMPLSSFGLAAIEGMIDHWKTRPVGKRGKPCSASHARNVIKRIRHFVRWLHKSEAFAWRKPVDFEVTPIKISLTQAEKSKRYRPTQVLIYTVDELAVLWKYASPRERVYLALALNCGFGQMDIATLQTEEIHFNQAHGYYSLSGSFIKRARNKTEIYAEWKLWDVTVTALEWFKRHRPDTQETAFLVTKDGRSLADPTAGNNRNVRIANAWTGLIARIKKDYPSFRRLSFNKLRKTAGDLVKKIADGEIAGVFHSRGQIVPSDDFADVYTNRPFDKVFATLDKVREVLAPVFGQVKDPFPEDAKRHNPALSIGTINKIVSMRRQGFKYAKIVEETGASKQTVRIYLQRAGLVKARQPKANQG